MKKYLLLAFVIAVVVAGAIGFWLYNKPERNLTNEAAVETLDTKKLYQQFTENETAANKKYLDKVIQVRGLLKTISPSPDGSLNLSLDAGSEMGGVTCEVPAANVSDGTNLKTGQVIAVKGQCTGYLTDVVLVKCVILP